MSRQNSYADPDDYFAHTRMSFGDHIEDLRRHLLWAIAGFFVAMIGSFFISAPILEFISAPVEKELVRVYDRRHKRLLAELKNDPAYIAKTKPEVKPQQVAVGPIKDLIRKEVQALLGNQVKLANAAIQKQEKWITLDVLVKPGENIDLMELLVHKLGPRPTLKVFRVEEGLMVFLKVAIVAGFVISFPWIGWQIWSFIAAGLYPHEKRLVNVYFPFSAALFLIGVIFCEWIVIPRAVGALLWFSEWLGFEPELRLSEWLSFAILVPVIFGLSFQTPLVMLMLERIGLVTIAMFKKFRRMAWFVMAILAAVLTPTGDPMTMMFLLLPMCGFYELGIWLCKMAPGRPLLEFDVPESEEMVEV